MGHPQLWGEGGPPALARRDSVGNVFYYFEDQIGSSRVVTNSSGVICYDADFAPYGQEQTTKTNNCAQNYKFSGKERDPDTLFDYFGARYYFSTTGKWISPDWSAKPWPIPYAKLDDPQSLNLYAFSADRPTAYLDPNGHEGEIADLCGGSGDCNQTVNPDGTVTVTVTTSSTTTTQSTDANGNTLTTVTTTTTTDTYTFSNVGNLVSGVQNTEVDSNTYNDAGQRVGGSDQTTTSALTLKDANQQFGTTTVGLFRDSFGPHANGFFKQVAHSIEKHPGTNAGRAIGLAVAVGCLAAEPCGGAAAAAGVGGAAGDAFDSIKDATDPSEGPF